MKNVVVFIFVSKSVPDVASPIISIYDKSPKIAVLEPIRSAKSLK